MAADGSISGTPLARAHGALREGVPMTKRKSMPSPQVRARAQYNEDDAIRVARDVFERIERLSPEEREAFEWVRLHMQPRLL